MQDQKQNDFVYPQEKLSIDGDPCKLHVTEQIILYSLKRPH
jgi:hypothetical protein